MLGYKSPQYCDIESNCSKDICCYECKKDICEYRCHTQDDKDYTKCKHAKFSKFTLD